MNILVSVNKTDAKCKVLDKDLIDYTVKNLEKKHKVFIYTKDDSIKKKFKDRILEAASEIGAIQNFSNGKDIFIFINRLALCNINFDNLIKYHTNHDKKITVVSKNFVKDKSIPIYKLNDKKEVIAVTRKRFADCGIYLFKKECDFSKHKHIFSVILEGIEKREIKGFVHKGYWWTSANIRRRNNGKSFDSR